MTGEIPSRDDQRPWPIAIKSSDLAELLIEHGEVVVGPDCTLADLDDAVSPQGYTVDDLTIETVETHLGIGWKITRPRL